MDACRPPAKLMLSSHFRIRLRRRHCRPRGSPVVCFADWVGLSSRPASTAPWLTSTRLGKGGISETAAVPHWFILSQGSTLSWISED